MIDLHIHSTASDGTFTPFEIIKKAEEMGLEAVSVTDHDTVDGSIEALKFSNDRVSVISGIEISSFPPQFSDFEIEGSFHVLGYLFDPFDKDLNEMLSKLKGGREDRNPLIIEKLNSLGFDITLDEVKELSGGLVGRPHIATVMLNKGYVNSISEAFNEYLANGAKAHVGKYRPDSETVIETIVNAGGIPVLAHPGLLGLKENEYFTLFEKLKEEGLVGIEAYYSKHDQKTTGFFIDCAKKFDLLITGGSDFHGENKEGVELGSGAGDLNIPYELYTNLLKTKNERHNGKY